MGQLLVWCVSGCVLVVCVWVCASGVSVCVLVVCVCVCASGVCLGVC